MPLRGVRTEVDTGRDRDTRPLEQIAGESETVPGQPAAIRVHIECTLWRDRYGESDLLERRHEVVTARPELEAARLQYRQGRRLEGSERRALGRRRRREIDVLGQLLDDG